MDLNAVALRVVEEAKQTARHHTVELVKRDEFLLVSGDESRLEQVLVNLLQNAVL